MLMLLRSEMELFVKSEFLYVPLLFDPSIARELQDCSGQERSTNQCASDESGTVIELDGNQFIKSLSIRSILANYDKIDKDHYEQLKRACLGETGDDRGVVGLSPNGKLRTIILKIMPHFVRKSRGPERRHFNDDEFMELICSKIDIPDDFMVEVDRMLDAGLLRRRLHDLDGREEAVKPLEEGRVTGEALLRWLRTALKGQIVSRERDRLEHELRERQRWDASKRKHIAAMLYLADKGSFELDGFGFSRIGSRDDYFIFKRTGEYILKDYYAQSYRFHDCRVAVSTAGPLRPLVLDYYKHPFLLHHAPKQEICLRGYSWPEEFTADNIIRLLEDGINALLYGYDARRRNGYHSLDRTLYYVKSIEFGDYRM